VNEKRPDPETEARYRIAWQRLSITFSEIFKNFLDRGSLQPKEPKHADYYL